MYPRLQAEEQTARITAARVAAGSGGDTKAKRAIEKYEAQLERQRDGHLTTQERASPHTRRLEAAALGLGIGKPEAVKRAQAAKKE